MQKAEELEEMNCQTSFLCHRVVMSYHPSSLCFSSAVSSLSLSAASPLLSTLSPRSVFVFTNEQRKHYRPAQNRSQRRS